MTLNTSVERTSSSNLGLLVARGGQLGRDASVIPSEALKVQANIESLELAEQFSLVILASSLIEHPAATVRQAFPPGARRHLAVGEKVLVERQDPEWLTGARVGKQGSVGDVSFFVESAERQGELVRMALR